MSSIRDYYAHKNVFITGATGFVGKLLVEKLLFSCDQIGKIYCLIREKNGHSAQERLNEITSSKVNLLIFFLKFVSMVYFIFNGLEY